jgi:hypothetical protein
MVKRFFQARRWQSAGLWLAVAVMALGAAGQPQAQAQEGSPFSPESKHSKHTRSLPQRPPSMASQPPAFSIPAEPLGFSAPGPLYLGMRISLASLDFLDENRLLFTFRVPGLIHRSAGEAEEDERRIRAVLLDLPSGTVEAEAVWTVHDRSRYLWMLRGGHFLLRDRDLLFEGDATLVLKPILRFPGPLTRIEIDPTQKYLVTDSQEPEDTQARSGDVASPATAAADMTVDDQPSGGRKDIVVRILHRESGKVMMVSHTRTTVHLPINDEGYLESLRSNGRQWVLNLSYFTGGSRILGHVNSSCVPTLDFVARREVLATTCDLSGGRDLVAMTTDGQILWEDSNSDVPVWPLLVMSPDGSRLARESLSVTHPIDASSPLGAEDIKGQMVEVFDAATGKRALTATANPVLDAGGNVAISPSGRRVAVIGAGAIQVFELPLAPPLPPAAGNHPAR